ncbi:tripartite tricarboxylate transporter substrate-binding protein [Ochrobactrum sp. RH2CCR150]|uniref:tripartite tricarboxylate transporter substrate binding protein n=1 Tax=Ochrobactrum sp. RH2CCR150 TaxID=2587044 RepID=UPI0015F8A86B|nr:tripartite-type tricarboxylate transporter receptor subunit TctC [Ochrobactrum sp. RH2CCR150]
MRYSTAVLGLIAAMSFTDMAQAEWKPAQDLEFVAGAGPGGGTDLFARTIQSIIQKYDLADVDIVVTNKPAGAGSEAFMYGVTGGKDPHKLLFGNNNAWLLPMKAKVGYSMDDLTPVASMAKDGFLLWTNKDRPYETYQDVVNAAKDPSTPLKSGGTQSKDGDEILVRMIANEAGGNFIYIPFKSGSEAAVQLAGGHIDINTNNPSENVGQWAGGAVRPICIFAAAKLEDNEKVYDGLGFGDIPTCASQGSKIQSYEIPRTIFSAAKLTEDQQAYFHDLLSKVREKPEWQAYLKKTMQGDLFLQGPELQTYIDQDSAAAKAVFEREGWLVK